DLSSGKRERVPAGAEFHRIDIRDAAALRALASALPPPAIFHLAAQAAVRVSVEAPGRPAAVNVRGTADALEAARLAAARPAPPPTWPMSSRPTWPPSTTPAATRSSTSARRPRRA